MFRVPLPGRRPLSGSRRPDSPTLGLSALERVGPTLGRRVDPAAALRTLGIEIGQIQDRLEATFGSDAVNAAQWRVRRRPRWRACMPGPSSMCGYLLAKRSMQFTAEFADRRGAAGIGPEHLFYGVLRDARDPVGAQLSRLAAEN